MAPGLEQEVVNQVLDEGNDEQYIWNKVQALKELGFEVDKKRVVNEIKRYGLLQKYNSQDNRRKTIKKRRLEDFRRLVEEKIEKLKEEDASIVSGKTISENHYRYKCNFCERYKIKLYTLRINCILKQKDDFYSQVKKQVRNFEYCWNCGHNTFD